MIADQIEIDLKQRYRTDLIRRELFHRRRRLLDKSLEFLGVFSAARLAELCDHFQLVAPNSKAGRQTRLASFLNAPEEAAQEDDEAPEEDDEAEQPSELDAPELKADERELLRFVPTNGSSIGNKRLREKLGWKEEKYWRVRDNLVDKEWLAVGFGRGGSVYRPEVEAEEEADEEADEDEGEHDESEGEADYDSETALYPPIRAMLEKNWQQLFPGFAKPKMLWVDSSPQLGRRATGGPWTRPDLSAVTINKYRYIPGVHLDVFTFEVKPRKHFNVMGLYEALGHSRRANFAYALFHVEGEPRRERLDEITREATRLKIGVATFEDPADADTYQVHVSPGRHEPEPRLLNEFIETLPEAIREAIEDAK